MLIDFDHGGVVVTKVPFQRDFRLWKGRMTATEIADVKNEIHRMLHSGEVHTTSWMPGSDWNGTPFQIIFEKGTRHSFAQAAMCFGLFVNECVLERCQNFDERWGFKHCEKDGYPIKGRTYFRLH
jgi:hypothetical protein